MTVHITITDDRVAIDDANARQHQDDTDAKLNKLDGRTQLVGENLEHLDTRLTALNVRIERLDKKVTAKLDAILDVLGDKP